MKQLKFYEANLLELDNDEVLRVAERRFPHSKKVLQAIQRNEFDLEDRIGNGECDKCQEKRWLILPISCNFVKEGGKSYIMCMNCGHITHL